MTVAWSVRIVHKNKIINGAPKLEGGVYDSHEDVCDLLNDKFELEQPFTVKGLEALYKKGKKDLQLINKKDGERCEVTLWNINGGK